MGSSNSFFTSTRERRLWLCALAVVVAIYSTLGLARTPAGVMAVTGNLALRARLIWPTYPSMVR